MEKLLQKIHSPQDIKGLTDSELTQLGEEIRQEIISVVSKNGGHLGSNLGVVELTLAIHRAINSPIDNIIWDVGHQSYVHKLLTGRYEEFKTLRQFGGMSGFPKRSESIHDTYDTGHSSNSISAGLGLAMAKKLSKDNSHVVVVIGDGALTGGMAYEALNHAGDLSSNLIVILNDNQMSISENTGGMSVYLNRLRTAPGYSRFKQKTEKLLYSIPIIGKGLFSMADVMKDALKYILIRGVMFEELGFKYFGVIDGHDIKTLETTIERAKQYKGKPVLIHVMTTKGKGYDFAVETPNKYHGVGPFDIEAGVTSSKSNTKSYSEIAGEALIECANKDEKIVAITAAMPDGTGLSKFASLYPDRFFDTGIAEQHAVTFSAGLALGGYKPFFIVYSTFLQRAYDQIIQDAAMQQLNIKLCIDRAGLVGNDGETHHGMFDIAYLANLPNLTILSPMNGSELREMIKWASEYIGPVAIRYPRKSEQNSLLPINPIKMGKGELVIKGEKVIVIAEGKMVEKAIAIAEQLKSFHIDLAVINIRFIKPLDATLLQYAFDNFDFVYSMEDGIKTGGLGSLITSHPIAQNSNKRFHAFAVEDCFVTHGEIDTLYEEIGLDNNSMADKIKSDLKEHAK